jgi:DNA-binding NtrC family response regulator
MFRPRWCRAAEEAGVARALLVEDDATQLEALERLLEREGFVVRTASSLAVARDHLARDSFDVLLADLRLGDGTALELLPDLEDRTIDLILVTGKATVESAVEAFRGGAVDYITKPVDVPHLRKLLANARRAARLRDQVGALRNDLRQLGRFHRLVGSSAPMQAVYDQILKVAPTNATVLISGPTGTGKELVAQAIHELSRRADGPFLPLNCGAVSPTLIESELFGHERGSFTGAAKQHIGFFERADGGTLFLDEITEMPLELQVKLLRTLENHEVRRIGGDGSIAVDVRLIAATNRDVHEAVAEGNLRQDLLYRLLVFPIDLPPLRSRDDDVRLLANHFLAELNRKHDTSKELTRAALERLRLYDWPGNVRELQNAIQRAYIEATHDIDADSLPLAAPAAPADDPGGLGIRVGMSQAQAERILTLATLDHYPTKKEAAEALGISLKTLYNRLNTYKGRPR